MQEIASTQFTASRLVNVPLRASNRKTNGSSRFSDFGSMSA
jgi:hypothetical protein